MKRNMKILVTYLDHLGNVRAWASGPNRLRDDVLEAANNSLDEYIKVRNRLGIGLYLSRSELTLIVEKVVPLPASYFSRWKRTDRIIRNGIGRTDDGDPVETTT